GSPKTTAVTFSRSISARTSFMYSPFAAGYNFGVHSSCTQPNGASFVFGSEAVNFAVFGHIGTAPGMSSIACTCTSSTGGTSAGVFCARVTPVLRLNAAAQPRASRELRKLHELKNVDAILFSSQESGLVCKPSLRLAQVHSHPCTCCEARSREALFTRGHKAVPLRNADVN